jgi:hypothetical protein
MMRNSIENPIICEEDDIILMGKLQSKDGFDRQFSQLIAHLAILSDMDNHEKIAFPAA